MGSRAEHSESGSSVPDDEWERFLQESVTGVPDAPKEPSARARLVTERLRDQPEPDGWRTYTPPRPRRFRARYVVGLLVAVALLVVAIAPDRVVGWFGDRMPNGTPLAAESERPESAPPAEPALRPTLDEPFRGSPAARWANGAAGVAVPEARATGWMTAAEVERALKRSRDFLAAANLDPAVLRGERPDRAIELINPHQDDVRSYLRNAFRSPGEDHDPLRLFSRFRASDVRLVGDVVKTRGRLSYEQGERGALRVTADVTFVYPVRRAAEGSDEVVRAVVRREVVMSWDDPSRVITEPGTFSLASFRLDVTNGGCGPSTGWFRPPFGKEHATDGATVDPYDRSVPLGEPARGASDECRVATRS